MAKTRMTPFARFLLFMLFFVPLVFVGASYYNGEDPVATAKNWLGMDATPTEIPTRTDRPNTTDAPATFENVQDMRDELQQLRRDLAVSQEQLARCQDGN